MKLVIIAVLAAAAVAAPQYSYSAPSEESSEEVEVQYSYSAPLEDSSEEVIEIIPIVRDDRVHEDDGAYTLDVETGNGIVLSQSGSPNGPDDSVVKSGHYSYTAPDGTFVEVKFVADENGFQPQSDLLPVAPAFPHPIPDFVLEQIAFAEAEDAARARAELEAQDSEEEPAAPSTSYGSPQ
ncbi:cuticle protein AM1199-like [Portunus trituberculatus]|uniref:cuticle protein AM1199-like n=1 Tax=Portunus trituberculatus TaxID=210409 RepID=UPI001E1CB0C2|nr:cuticle protein AM1199-like [Portunus trituberculatus]XP_045135715.1 cuticle protein AM1199-like [Portunus trituberculatus]